MLLKIFLSVLMLYGCTTLALPVDADISPEGSLSPPNLPDSNDNLSSDNAGDNPAAGQPEPVVDESLQDIGKEMNSNVHIPLANNNVPELSPDSEANIPVYNAESAPSAVAEDSGGELEDDIPESDASPPMLPDGNNDTSQDVTESSQGSIWEWLPKFMGGGEDGEDVDDGDDDQLTENEDREM